MLQSKFVVDLLSFNLQKSKQQGALLFYSISWREKRKQYLYDREEQAKGEKSGENNQIESKILQKPGK